MVSLPWFRILSRCDQISHFWFGKPFIKPGLNIKFHRRSAEPLKDTPYSWFSHDVTTAMLVPLNKEKAAMLVPRPNPPGI